MLKEIFMKNEQFKIESTTEICDIRCCLHDAKFCVRVSEDDYFKVVYPSAKNINVALGEGTLLINQAKRHLAFSAQNVTLFVPSHAVPNLIITGKNPTVCINGGILGNVDITLANGKINLANTAFLGVQAICNQAYVHLYDVTIKQRLFIRIKLGKLITENSFALNADCRLEVGNAGLINLSGNDFDVETGKGNVTLTAVGTEEEYTTSVRVKNGTTNKQSNLIEGAQKSIKAYAENGNVTINFVGEKIEIKEAAVAQE